MTDQGKFQLYIYIYIYILILVLLHRNEKIKDPEMEGSKNCTYLICS